MSAPLVRLEGVRKTYALGRAEVHALRGIDLAIRHGEMVAVMGPSGSGKTTLLEILGCLSQPSEGRYWLDDRPVDAIDADGLARLRGERIGFVFQSFNLLPRLPALENVALPLVYRRVARAERGRRAHAALVRVGLEARASHLPSELSGGERQRVAIARALVTSPDLVLADEPTGNLDSATGADILALLHALHRDGRTLVIVTHDPGVAAQAERRLVLRDGRIVTDEALA